MRRVADHSNPLAMPGASRQPQRGGEVPKPESEAVRPVHNTGNRGSREWDNGVQRQAIATNQAFRRVLDAVFLTHHARKAIS